MNSETGGSRTDTMIKLVLIFFISLLSFSVGTYVGKQVSDSDHRRAQIEGDYKAIATNDVDEAQPDKNSGEEKLSEEEIASLTEEFITKEKSTVMAEEEPKAREIASEPADAGGYKKYKPTPAAVKPEPTAEVTPPAPKAMPLMAQKIAPTPVAETPAAEPTKPTPMATRIAEGHPPTPEMKTERKPLSVLPSVAATAVGKYTVQVASYPDEDQAKTHAADLKGKGWNAFYIPAEISGKTYFRVSVGLFTTAKSAKEFKTEFQKEAKVGIAIVQKIVQ